MGDEMMSYFEQQLNDTVANYEAQIRELNEKIRIYEQSPTHSPEDIARLEMDLRTEKDNTNQLRRQNQDLEQKARDAASRLQQLESKLFEDNQEMNLNAQVARQKTDRITELEKRIQDLQAIIDKNKAQLLDNHGEGVRRDAILIQYRQQNQQLQDEMERVLDKYSQLTQDLMQRGNEVSDLQEEIRALKKRILSAKTGAPKKEEDGDSPPDGSPNTSGQENIETTLRENEEQLEEILSLRQQVDLLKEEADSAARLQLAIRDRNVQIDKLNNDLQEARRQSFDDNRTVGQLLSQIEEYRLQREQIEKDADADRDRIVADLDFYKTQYEKAAGQQDNLAATVIEQSAELEQLQNQVHAYEEGTYGLPEAVKEMKELRAMVDLRDKHIAEMVMQANSTDKILTGLTNQLSPDFDMDGFLNKINKNAELDAESLMEKKAREELEAKVKMMKAREPNSIKVVVDDVKPRRKTFAETTQRKKTRHSEEIEKTAPAKKKAGRFKPERSSTSILNITSENAPALALSECDHFEKPGYFLTDYEESIAGDDARDEWVRNIQTRLKSYMAQNDQLRDANYQIHEENAQLRDENARLRERGDTFYKSGDRHTTVQQTAQMQTSDIQAPPQTYPTRYIPETRPATQRARLEIQRDAFRYEVLPAKPHFQVVRMPEDTVFMKPDKEEMAIFDAQKNILLRQLEETQQKASEALQDLESTATKLRQRDEQLLQLNDTIAQLQAKLNDERSQHKEALLQMRNDAELLIKQQLSEAEDARNVHAQAQRHLTADSTALAEVSMRLSQLTQEKNMLADELSMTHASVGIAQREAAVFKQRVIELEAEIALLRSRQVKPADTGSDLREYHAKVSLQLKKLKAEHQTLKQQYEELKQRRGDTVPREAEYAIDESMAVAEGKGAPGQIRAIQGKLVKLQQMNDDLQGKLGRANCTIDRLNQLLQRKESQITKLHEQLAKSTAAAPPTSSRSRTREVPMRVVPRH